MQSALLRYLSYKYYYCILSMMMMPKEGMVIVFFDNRNIGLVEKSSLYLSYRESYDNFIDFTAAILNFSFQKKPLKE